MSGMALIWASNVKGLKPAAKIVLIQLADFHNKETGQCNPSAKRLADECEMGRATLFRHMMTLEQSGLVTRHARGDNDWSRTTMALPTTDPKPISGIPIDYFEGPGGVKGLPQDKLKR